MIRFAFLFLCAASLFAAEEGGIKEVGIGWKWANFALLCAFLGYMISKHAGPFFRDRTGQIQAGLSEAAKMKDEADRKVADINHRLANLENELASLRDKSKQEMQQEAQRIEAETARRIARIQVNVENEMAAAVKRARQELRTHAAELAVQLAAGQVKHRLTPETQEQLVSSFVAQMAEPSKN